MRGTIVAILRGGPEPHRERSLASGHAFLNALPAERYTVRDIHIDHEGVWYERGIPTTAEKVLRSSDSVLSALHGPYGEGGQMQRLFEQSGIPYNGADSFASYSALHKLVAKRHAEDAGLLTPRFAYVEPGMDISNVVKPAASSGSLGVSRPHGFAPLRAALVAIVDTGGSALVEEQVRGTEASVSLIEGMRGEALYALPPVEIASGRQYAPGRFPRETADALIEAARTMHQALGLRHYSRTDFIVTPRGIQFLETSSLPTMGVGQTFPHSLGSVGITLPDFAEHLVSLSLG